MTDSPNNIRVRAKTLSINSLKEVWGLSEAQATVKFESQPKKWQKRQVNKALKTLGK